MLRAIVCTPPPRCLLRGETEAVGQAVSLPHRLTHSVNAGRMSYLARTTPSAACAEAAEMFDDAVLQAAAAAVGQQWSAEQREQATLSAKQGGLGLRKVADVADSAYVASRAATHEWCEAIRPTHRWDAQEPGSPLAEALGRLPAAVQGERERDKLTQTRLAKSALDSKLGRWQAQVGPADRTRRKAYATKGAAYLYEIVPSMTLDTHLHATVFATTWRSGSESMSWMRASRAVFAVRCWTAVVYTPSRAWPAGTRSWSTTRSGTSSLTTRSGAGCGR
jgi:hypothetical protein